MVPQGVHGDFALAYNARVDGLDGVPGEYQVVGPPPSTTSPVSHALSHILCDQVPDELVTDSPTRPSTIPTPPQTVFGTRTADGSSVNPRIPE